MNPRFRLSTTVLTTGILVTGLSVDVPVYAQQIQSPVISIFENVTLSPDFSPDPTTIRGISGGPLTASNVAGRTETATGPCAGFVDEQPDHTIQLTEFFSYLSIQVESPEDTTLVVRGPGGSWCNDDYQSNNPGIAGQWLSGDYEVWVGSYNRDSYHPYVIRISDSQ
ncbi:hypothetical protein H6F93_09000 [Leptolyngbya sp. FACHB-671]|nr:hypothetical protein [Leptolyngbya sp. FACHB-671]